jgi:hypothetical protein
MIFTSFIPFTNEFELIQKDIDTNTMLQAIAPTLEHFAKSIQKVATDIKNNRWYRKFVVSCSSSLFLQLPLFDFFLD